MFFHALKFAIPTRIAGLVRSDSKLFVRNISGIGESEVRVFGVFGLKDQYRLAGPTINR